MNKGIDYKKQIILPTMLGIEAAAKRELLNLDLPKGKISVADGVLSFMPEDESHIPLLAARCNYNCRTVERVLVQLASFEARDFDQLYDYSSKLSWEDWLDKDFFLSVNGYSLRSDLYGVPSMQAVIKKAIVDRLVRVRKLASGSKITEDRKKGEMLIRFSAVDNKISLMLDSSGQGLHKRGYRPLTHAAPIRETLAAAILDYLFYAKKQKEGEILFDPVCGSGTFLIEAAMISAGLAPGLKRVFAGQNIGFLGQKIFTQEKEYALAKKAKDLDQKIICYGSDISAPIIEEAKKNAHRAGVDKMIKFERRDLNKIKVEEILALSDRALIVANPPYGERMGTAEDSVLISQALADLALDLKTGANKPGIRFGVISADKDFEEHINFRADKRRKLYNGMIPCQLYQYFKTQSREKIK